jgi:predicted alpha/beta superfamily hydrolase
MKRNSGLSRFCLAVLVAWLLAGCVDASNAPVVADRPTAAAPAPPAISRQPGAQRGGGQPYEILGSEVWNIPDPVSGRDYQVFVALPPSYAAEPQRRYPVLYVTDADYAFPLIRQIGRRLNVDGPKLEEFILVGLSYAVGEDGMASRRRDYTPTPRGASSAPPDALHGEGPAYATYLRDHVLPFIAKRYRTDERRRLLLGHSYGGLLGAQILFTTPELFSGYVLGSPSFWYDDHVMQRLEAAYATVHRDLPVTVYLYVGEFEDRNPGDPRYAKRHDMVTDARRMAQTLRARRYPSLRLQLDVVNDEDHLSVAPRGFTRGLKYLLGTH